jgi:hypothetical protein
MKDELIALARAAGLAVKLDGVIDRQHYTSVTGTLEALQRFGDAYHAALEEDGLKDRARPDTRANQPTEKKV